MSRKSDLILDTNGLSAIAEGVAGAVALFSQAGSIAIPVVALGEFRFGIGQSRVYAAVRAELKKAGTPIPQNDVWIAALCREHRLPLLSQDGHFDRVKGLKRFAW